MEFSKATVLLLLFSSLSMCGLQESQPGLLLFFLKYQTGGFYSLARDSGDACFPYLQQSPKGPRLRCSPGPIGLCMYVNEWMIKQLNKQMRKRNSYMELMCVSVCMHRRVRLWVCECMCAQV